MQTAIYLFVFEIILHFKLTLSLVNGLRSMGQNDGVFLRQNKIIYYPSENLVTETSMEFNETLKIPRILIIYGYPIIL